MSRKKSNATTMRANAEQHRAANDGYKLKLRPRRNLHAWSEFHTPIYKIGDLDKFYQDKRLNFVKALPSKSKQCKKSSTCKDLREVFFNFCSRSSLHGLQYLGDKTFSKTERFFWLFAFVAATAFSVYFITNIYEKFQENPVIVSFNPTLINLDQIPFPAITICNVNIATKVSAERINNFGSEVDKRLLDDMCNFNSTDSFSNYTNMKETGDWNTVRKFIISISQKCSSMFKVCKWENRVINCDLIINTILTDEGYCCSFNRLPANYSLRDNIGDDLGETYPDNMVDWNPESGYPPDAPYNAFPWRSFGAGVALGLTVVLDADLEEYYCTTTSSTGFKVLVSNPIESPKVADVGFLVSPGDESRIVLEPKIQEATMGLKSIDILKRQCFFAHERYLKYYRTYSQRNCQLECQANYTLKVCGCVPYYLPKNLDTKICDKKKEICSHDARYVIERFTPERHACNCLPGCFELSYQKKTASRGKINAKYNMTIDAEYRQNTSHQYFSENMAIMHFFFNRDKFSKQTKSELYGFSEFLSNTGGLLGLFLGFSFISAVEVIYFLLIRTSCVVYKSKLNEDSNENYLPFVK